MARGALRQGLLHRSRIYLESERVQRCENRLVWGVVRGVSFGRGRSRASRGRNRQEASEFCMNRVKGHDSLGVLYSRRLLHVLKRAGFCAFSRVLLATSSNSVKSDIRAWAIVSTDMGKQTQASCCCTSGQSSLHIADAFFCPVAFRCVVSEPAW